MSLTSWVTGFSATAFRAFLPNVAMPSYELDHCYTAHKGCHTYWVLKVGDSPPKNPPPNNQQLFFSCQYASSAGDHEIVLVQWELDNYSFQASE
jgi:hypothetical protein